MNNIKTKIKGRPAEKFSADKLDTFKRLATVAMFADDELLDRLVLKGGNAMELVYRVSTRASVDLDFSMKDDFDQVDAERRVQASLERTFQEAGYVAFDVKLNVRPQEIGDVLAPFWGGYEVEFKLISVQRADEVARDLETMRREAIALGERSRFTMDISRHEYTDDKREVELDGYQIYVYSPEMIVCEKLRAICQQMPEYEAIVPSGKGGQRARDFIDIETLMRAFDIDLEGTSAHHILKEMFALKKVPLSFLPRIADSSAFHALGYEGVRATVKPGTQLQPWDFYFDFVVAQLEKLKPLWDV